MGPQEPVHGEDTYRANKCLISAINGALSAVDMSAQEDMQSSEAAHLAVIRTVAGVQATCSRHAIYLQDLTGGKRGTGAI